MTNPADVEALASRKAHYFTGSGRSACGRWLYTGQLTDNQSDKRSDDDCAECWRRLARMRGSNG